MSEEERQPSEPTLDDRTHDARLSKNEDNQVGAPSIIYAGGRVHPIPAQSEHRKPSNERGTTEEDPNKYLFDSDRDRGREE
jgi:hypothetical protein